MATTTPSKEDIAEKGEQIYDTQLRDLLEPDYTGKFVAIDVHSGDYAIADTILGAANGLTAKRPASENYIMKIGYSTAVAMGARLTPRPPKDNQ